MRFREASAWIMSLALLVGGGAYLVTMLSKTAVAARSAPALPGAVVVAVIALLVVAIGGHTVVAAPAPGRSSAPHSDVERMSEARSGRLGGSVLSAGVVLSLVLFLAGFDALLFHSVVFSLVVGQLAEHDARIYGYRSGRPAPLLERS